MYGSCWIVTVIDSISLRDHPKRSPVLKTGKFYFLLMVLFSLPDLQVVVYMFIAVALISTPVFSEILLIVVCLFVKLPTLPEHLSSPPVFNGVRVTRSFVLSVCYVNRCLSFCPFSVVHCVVVLPLCYLQGLFIRILKYNSSLYVQT